MSILAYHKVERRFDIGVTQVTPGQFEKQIVYCLNNGYVFQTVSEYINDVSNDTKRVALTFDDGYESVYLNAFPVLQKYGLKATVFTSPCFMGKMNTWDVNWFGIKSRHLNWDQCRHLAQAGWETGSHTMNHYDLTQIPKDVIFTELQISREILINSEINFNNFLAFPFGNTNAVVSRLCEEAGYIGALVMGRGPKKIPVQYNIPRLGVYLFDTLLTFQQKLSAGSNHYFYKVQDFINFCSNGSVIVKKKSWKH